MDVKNKNRIGYKRTKLGWIPEEWVDIAFGEVFEFLKTYAFSREQLTLASQESAGIYNIHYGDVHATYDGYVLDFEKEKTVPLLKKATEIPSNPVLLQEGDLIIADVSEDYEGVGACVELRNIGSRKVTGGLHTFVARDKRGHSALGYRSFLLKHPAFVRRLKQISTGVSVHGVSKGNLSREKILLPPLPEQEAIAGVLECWDRGIKNLELRIEKKRNIKKGLMQKLLSGQIRLPGFGPARRELRIENREFRIPEGWKEVRLGEVSTIYDGTHMTPKYVEQGVPFYSVEHLTGNNFQTDKFISPEVFEKECKRVRIEQGDILMTRIGDIGTSKYIDWEITASFYVSLALLKNTGKMCFEFLNHYIGSHAFQKELWRRTIHVAYPEKINLGEIGKFKILRPSLEEQRAIATVLSAADREITALERKLAALRNQKCFLLNNLVTGSLRLPEFRIGNCE